jgi:pimeloyl-ACP methyl ester carboxylesterase
MSVDVRTDKVSSADGTAIAYDRFGDGSPVIIVGGLLCDRAKTRPIATELASRFTVINYDRRGRGESGDTPPYAVEREVEDLAALLAAVGGNAAIYAHSSGAGLALHAAARGLSVTRLVVHEPPYARDVEEERRSAREFAETLLPILAEGRRGDAVALVATTIMGMPAEMVDQARTEPWWAEMEAMAPTIAYDSAVMGDRHGGTIPFELVAAVTVPTLVLAGGASPPEMIEVAQAVAAALPNGRCRVLADQEHVVPPEILVPVLTGFFADQRPEEEQW